MNQYIDLIPPERRWIERLSRLHAEEDLKVSQSAHASSGEEQQTSGGESFMVASRLRSFDNVLVSAALALLPLHGVQSIC